MACVVNCTDETGATIPLEVTVAGFEFNGDLNVSPDGPVAVDICVNDIPGVLFGQCNDGVGTWKAHDIGGGVTLGLPDEFTFGPCPIEVLPELEICDECWIDDVNGDGSNLVGFIRRTSTIIDRDSGTKTRTVLLDLTVDAATKTETVYNATNPVPCSEVGAQPQGLLARRETVVGPGAWSAPTQEILDFLFTGIQGTATVTDSAGITSTLNAGETYGDQAVRLKLFFTPVPTLNVPAGSVVNVAWTEYLI